MNQFLVFSEDTYFSDVTSDGKYLIVFPFGLNQNSSLYKKPVSGTYEFIKEIPYLGNYQVGFITDDYKIIGIGIDVRM